MKIFIIDNGMGNINSIVNALKILQFDFEVSDGLKKGLDNCFGMILPGVGAFPFAVQNLKKNSLYDQIEKEVFVNKKPFLGICLGMQLLASDSNEQIYTKGFDFINGNIDLINTKSKNFPVPHVGWNQINIIKKNILFKDIDNNSNFYFDHSYHFTNIKEEYVYATSKYGIKIVSSIQKDNIFGVQFHPEKSQINGLRLLKNFANFAKLSVIKNAK